MSMESNVTCPSCGAALATQGLTPGMVCQCGRCGASFSLSGEAAQTSGKAIASLTLGLLSIIGLCLTGVPAIIFGALALGDIRRSAGRLSGRGLAISGIVLGSLCGLICTPIVGGAMWLTLSIASETQMTDDPVEIAVIADRIGQYEIPAGLKPEGGMDTGAFGFRLAAYTDATEGEANTMLMLMQFPTWIPFSREDMEVQMQQQWRSQEHDADLDVRETRQLTFTVRGEETIVTEMIGTDPETGRGVRQYVGVVPLEKGQTMIMLYTRDPAEPETKPPTEETKDAETKDAPPPAPVRITEEQVRQFFESFE